MVYIVNDGLKVIACRSGNNNMLSASINVSLSLSLACVEACALKNYVDIQLTPRKVSSVLLGIDRDLMSINDDGVLCALNLVSKFELALCRVILEQVCKHSRGCKVVDCYDLKPLCCVHLTECQTANTTKTVNCNSYCHNRESSCENYLIYIT